MCDYAVKITLEDGDHVVSVRDLPEVVTSGNTLEQALERFRLNLDHILLL